ncbi:hypothetical protein G9P44_005770 [Scheffersomyces stipitis]|nr:hypothetical protein G9P44_005770 [Scheffersomyces stipitis]
MSVYKFAIDYCYNGPVNKITTLVDSVMTFVSPQEGESSTSTICAKDKTRVDTSAKEEQIQDQFEVVNAEDYASATETITTAPPSSAGSSSKRKYRKKKKNRKRRHGKIYASISPVPFPKSGEESIFEAVQEDSTEEPTEEELASLEGSSFFEKQKAAFDSFNKLSVLSKTIEDSEWLDKEDIIDPKSGMPRDIFQAMKLGESPFQMPPQPLVQDVKAIGLQPPLQTIEQAVADAAASEPKPTKEAAKESKMALLREILPTSFFETPRREFQYRKTSKMEEIFQSIELGGRTNPPRYLIQQNGRVSLLTKNMGSFISESESKRSQVSYQYLANFKQ